MKTVAVYIDGIAVGERLRKLDSKKVASLAKSMEAIGLQQPITVWGSGEDVVLVAGAHRLAAAQKLGWDQIDCIFITLDDLHRQLWEIDENLMRADLTELERAEHLKKRKAVFKKIGGQTSPTKKPQHERGFAKDTEEKTGTPKRTVNQSVARAEKISPKVKALIKNTPAADKGVELDAIASLDPEEQEQAVERVKSGASRDFREAKTFIRGDAASEEDKQFEAIKKAYLKAGGKARQRFLDWVNKSGRKAA